MFVENHENTQLFPAFVEFIALIRHAQNVTKCDCKQCRFFAYFFETYNNASYPTPHIATASFFSAGRGQRAGAVAHRAVWPIPRDEALRVLRLHAGPRGALPGGELRPLGRPQRGAAAGVQQRPWTNGCADVVLGRHLQS